ncbi:DNA-binding CsgD family transcriptional regulator/tetratricopeptide (TPR) repeat protein [Arthrobacter sp. SORGH_AS 212]|uniref:helix-turn-helix transcriptional regulator n=1 Tax=Pseudarthrobacter sp. SORGH_AS 212 TaxID=3041777 RepID=UPI002783B3ED|nr:DNA-binding CsgD family transcriptional regulator/tetratricopeptide (TPR) repeat protein [Arthrobacter sp. SORGH_AS_0212]
MDNAAGNHPSQGIIRAAELHDIVVALSGPEPAGVLISGAGGSGMTTLLDAAASVLEGTFSVVARTAASSFADVPFSIAMALVPDLPAKSNASPRFLVQASRQALRSAGPPGTPVLLALDNIDFLDDLSLWLLNRVVSEPDIRLLATHRSDRPLRMELMESVVARQLSVVNLSELGPERMRDFLASRLQGRPSEGLVRNIQADSAGNMLAARLLLDAAVAGGGVACSGGEWSMARDTRGSTQIQELVTRRLAMYPHQQRQLIDFLAVGEPLSVGVAEALAGSVALAELRSAGAVRIQDAGLPDPAAATATLNHVLEAGAALQQLAPDRQRELRLALRGQMSHGDAGSLWDLFRRVALEQVSGLPTPDADLLAVAVAANDLHDSHRARQAAAGVTAPELRLPAGVEHARALYLMGDIYGSVQLLRRLLASSDGSDNREFLRAVWLLLRALYPTSPDPNVLHALVDDARRRVEAAADAEPFGGQEARDELDVLQLYLDAQSGTWPRAGDALYQRLSRQHTIGTALGGDHRDSGETGGPPPLPTTEAGVLLMALVSQGLAVGGRFAEAVELSTAALESLEHLPRCTVDFHAVVLIIHGSNLIWRGQWGGREMVCSGAPRQTVGRLSYFEGPAHLYRAFVLARQGSLDLACEHFRQAKVRFDEADPEGLLPVTLGGLAAAAWLLGDVGQVRRALAAYDARRQSGSYLAARLADSYSSAARSVVSGAGSSNRRLLQLADTAGKRGHRALENLNLGLAARTGARGVRSHEVGVADLIWTVTPAMLGESQDDVPAFRPEVAFPGDDDPDQEDVLGTGDMPASGATAARPAAALPDLGKLSNREREVAGLIASGLSSAEAAVRLGISVNTVNAHLQRTYGKLGVSSRQELSEVWNHGGDFPE